MSYIALYRKFRPAFFYQVVGQDHVVRTLKNQLINKRVGHAYLFTGTRGTGKTSAAKIFAKALNCLNMKDGEPCNECENCRAIDAGNFVDVVEVDAASNNGVDDIRRIIEEIRYTPARGAYKVFIIDEAHMITGPAFNAFLKTLEEPPAYAVFILATTEPHKLPITILSRVQRYDFHRISTEYIAGNLKNITDREGVEAQEKALKYIARMGDGSMRDSVSLLDKCIAFNLGEELTYEKVLDTLGTVDTEIFSALFKSVYKGNVPAVLNTIDDAAAQGRDLARFASDFIWYVRNVLLAGASEASDMEMLGVSAENMNLIREDAKMARPDVLMRYIRILSETIDRMRFSSGKQILLETAFIKLAKPEMETDVQSLSDRIRKLEEALAGGIPVMAGQNGNYAGAADDSFYEDRKPRMKNPDAFAGLLDDDFVPASREPARQPGAAAAENGNDSRFWQDVVNGCDSIIVRKTLNKCTGSISDDNVLEISAPNDFIRHQLNDSQIMEQIREIASRIRGVQVQVRILTGSGPLTAGAPASRTAAADPPKESAADAFPEDLLKNINFNIGTEEY